MVHEVGAEHHVDGGGRVGGRLAPIHGEGADLRGRVRELLEVERDVGPGGLFGGVGGCWLCVCVSPTAAAQSPVPSLRLSHATDQNNPKAQNKNQKAHRRLATVSGFRSVMNTSRVPACAAAASPGTPQPAPSSQTTAPSSSALIAGSEATQRASTSDALQMASPVVSSAGACPKGSSACLIS